MNVDTLLHQYFPDADNVCIEMFDEKNIQQVYRRLVEVLIHQPEVETSLLQGMSYCFYEVMDNVMIHSGKTVGIVITNYSEPDHLIQILVADDGMGFGLYSTSRLINTAGHKLIIRSGNHTLSANGDLTVSESEPWEGTIVYFELRSNMGIDPASVVDHRTDPADEFDELFLDNNPELDKLW